MSNKDIELINGLSSTEAKQRLSKFGPNQLTPPSHISFWGIARQEVTEPMILLLIFVGVIYSIWGKPEDTITILCIILALVFVEVWNEFRAKKAIDALSKMAAVKVRVQRDNQPTEITAEQVVPGDILLLIPGTKISADAQVSASLGLQVDESIITGESAPVFKDPNDTILAGTLVVAGEGRAEVTQTGASTQFGKIAKQAKDVKPPRTPLQIAMKKLTGYLVWVALFFSITIPLLGVLRGQPLQESILTGLALAFATIPEEGPIIVTMVLGLGAYQLSKKNFLVKKLKAAETLGDATVILTDKTGTLTENRMKVVATYPANQKVSIIEAAVALQTDASPLPDDVAIRTYSAGINTKASDTILAKRGFTTEHKTKSALQQTPDGTRLIIVGAPEEIFAIAKNDTPAYKHELAKQTQSGHRVIAVATKSVRTHSTDLLKLEHDVDLLGLIIIEDPARPGVSETLHQAARAGIRTIMVTGDHPQTAEFIAAQVGIDTKRVVTGEELSGMSDDQLKEITKTASVYARSTPTDKYRLLQALQSNGEVVAVTGDGVNDTLALKGANVGIAMGTKGTDAAKEAADIVLADDNYSTIANGIFEGRKFFDNLRKGFQYYLSVKFALIIIFILPIILGIGFPFAPVQIILLELFMDLAASWAFVAEPAEPTIYNDQPRKPSEQLISRSVLARIALSGISLFVAVWGSYLYATSVGFSPETARTCAFAAWIIAHIFLAFITRSSTVSLFKIGFFSNKAILVWAIVATAFLLTITSVPAIAIPLKVTTLGLDQLAIVTLISFVAITWQELPKLVRHK